MISLFSKIKKTFSPVPTIKFKCDIPGYEIGQPVKLASDIKPEWMIKQHKTAERTGDPKFAACPGMHDFYQAGYIIPAWEDFEIIVTKTEIKINIGVGQSFVCKPTEKMQYSVVAGAANIDEDITPHAMKLVCPWKVFTKPGYSAFVMPALFHSPFLRDIFVYPGIIDYDRYHTINVMFSPLKEMHIKIYAGTPLLQVFPYKREPVSAEVGIINQNELSTANFTFRTRAPGFFRKWIHQQKTTTIDYI
jgi:hypothetical protein